MVESKASDGDTIELTQEVEGNEIGTKNYRFSKIGEPLPIKPDDAEEFDPQNPPSQPLAVSERYGLVFVAHSTGMYIYIYIYISISISIHHFILCTCIQLFLFALVC